MTGDERWAKVPRRVARDRTLTGNDFRVYTALGRCANRVGEARPSQATLVAESGLPRRTVRRSVDRLAARGHVYVDDVGGGNRAARYVLAGFVDDPLGAPLRPNRGVNGRTRAPKAREVGAPVRPKAPADVDPPDSMGAVVTANGRTGDREWAHQCATNRRTDEQSAGAGAREGDEERHACGHPATDPVGSYLGDGRTWCVECAAAATKGT